MSVHISKDEKQRPFGFVSFLNDKSAQDAIDDVREKQFAFPGNIPLYINIAQQKEERQQFNQFQHNQNVNNTLQNQIIDTSYVQAVINDLNLKQVNKI